MKKMTILLLLFTIFVFARPIVGEADSLTYERDKIIYTGNVRMTRGNALLTAQKVVIYLDEKKKAKLIEAEGNVKYVEGNRKGFADKMIYDVVNEVITLEGKARVEEGQNFVDADKIIYYRKEDKALAIGRSSRVRTFYVEEGDEKSRPNRKP